jgi:hypothetical protein
MNFAEKLIEMEDFFPEEYHEQIHHEPIDNNLIRQLNSIPIPESSNCDDSNLINEEIF